MTLLFSFPRHASSSCPAEFVSRLEKPRSQQFLKEAILEKDRFVLENGLVSVEDSNLAKAAIEKYPHLNGEKAININVYGGGSRPISFEQGMPDEVKQIFRTHLEKLNQRLSERFSKVEFLTASIRLSANGEFDVGHLHLDFGGFDPNTYSTSTTINLDGHGTLVASPQAVERFNSLPADAHPLKYRDIDRNFVALPGYGVRSENLNETPPGTTMVIHRRFDGGPSTIQGLTGKKSEKEQQELLYQSGPWHSSPALLPIHNPKRFWIGVIFYAEK